MDRYQGLFNLFRQNQNLPLKRRGDIDQVDFYLSQGLSRDSHLWDRDVQRPFCNTFRLKSLPKRINLINFLFRFKRDWLPSFIQVFEGNRLDIQDIFRFIGDLDVTLEARRLDDLFRSCVYDRDDFKVPKLNKKILSPS